MTRPTDVRVVEVEPFFSTERSEGGLGLSKATITELTLCHVRAVVETSAGARGEGWGAIFLSHPWALHAGDFEPARADALMRSLTQTIARWYVGNDRVAHPIELFMEVDAHLPAMAKQHAGDAWTHLASLVCASPVDAAIHDAFGLANGFSSYAGYGASCAPDLGAWLGDDFAGRYVDDYVSVEARPSVAWAHTIALGDALDDRRLRQDGARHIKLKLRGNDPDWDLRRIAEVFQMTGRSVTIGLDPNEQCPDVRSMIALLEQLRRSNRDAYDAISFVEQPFDRRVLHDVRPLAAMKPVILDEGFSDLDAVRAARDLGWSGIALKTCKTQSLALVATALATELGMSVSVQDLSNVGVSMLQSLGLAARLPGAAPMEANARQYFPHASAPEAARHPVVAHAVDGELSTRTLTGPGLGYDVEHIARPLFQGALR